MGAHPVMRWEFPHRVEYSADAQSVDEVVATLLAQKRLIEEGAAAFCAVTGIDLEQVDIRVVNVASGSLLTELLVQLYGAYQSDISGVIVEGIEEVLGEDIPAEWEAVVTLLTLAVLYVVMRFAYDTIRGRKSKDSPATTHIEGDYNKVINIVASKLDCPVEHIEGVLEGQLPRARRRSLVKHVTDFLNLARKKRGTDIEVEGFGKIAPEAIEEYPSDAELLEIDDTRNLDMPDAEIDIRATDRDRNKTGWAARIIGQSQFKRRLPMDLYPTVDAKRLAALERVRADLIIQGETDADGKFRPKKIHLLNFKEPAEDAKSDGSSEDGQEGD